MTPLQLETVYHAIEARYEVVQGQTALADAVHFGSNRTRPVHRWFHFKEALSADIFTALGLNTESMCKKGATFVDPFCGCGTTLLAGDLQHRWRGTRIGVEVNPFLAFVARTKVSWRAYDPKRLARCATRLLRNPLSEDFAAAPRPPLSTFENAEMIAPERLSALLDAVQRIKGLDVPERDLLLLGVASAVERVSFFRKDGRALRILRTPAELSDRHSTTVYDALQRTWSMMVDDLQSLQNCRREVGVGPCFVVEGDGRTLCLPADPALTPNTVSLITYSPPYLNHIDYTEVYKVELWLSGFVQSREEMLAIRKRTLRSHASIGVATTKPNLPDRVGQALELATASVAVSDKPWHRNFGRLALAYLTDMRASLERQFELLRPGSHCVCVVANSAHGTKNQRVPIAVDLLLASLAESVGFDVERIVVARRMRRRDHVNRFLRESAIMLRRPKE